MVASPPAAARTWTPDSWRTMPIKQTPTYPDQEAVEAVEKRLRGGLPLVFSGETDRLTEALARASQGKAFVLQGGDCAESFDEFAKYGGNNIADTFMVLMQMSIVLTYAIGPVVKIGRMAGQFAKPRSSAVERAKNAALSLPSYRGDMINGEAFEESARVPDPERMWTAFMQSTATMNLLRTLATGGALDLSRVQDINLKFVEGTPAGSRFSEYVRHVSNALRFMNSCGVPVDSPALRAAEFYVSHEALLLPYEESLCRPGARDSGKVYATSGHFLWLGDRTRQVDGAHVEFLRGIANPIGIKCGPTLDPAELLQLLAILNPDNTPGRITLITRMGAAKVATSLPPLIRAVQSAGAVVTWVCDPMHGNTESSPSGYKTRPFENVLEEVRGFFAVHAAEGSIAGGMHLELTGQDVTECVGGMQALSHEDLANRYESSCDPRLNASQALELSFLVPAGTGSVSMRHSAWLCDESGA
ncbi:hypothetical protein I4F81_006604 [Pyropia yezoensis]|uniref:Uncharacterized protein n=1 Tax=Pyropia yezoensis TaxID=2788 RepID=A0ACC3C270_PYRYE|nr:hypothetical protein I4F81_006604 [Neopyropia yezoensis]